MQYLSAPQHLWYAAGRPEGKWVLEPVTGVCSTCAAPLTEGVQTAVINNPTFAQHADFFRFGTHCCGACAWLYSDPKRTHRNVLAVGDTLRWPKIVAEPGRPQ